MSKIILASSSPRRKEIFSALGFDFEIRVSPFDESTVSIEAPHSLVKTLAEKKAISVVEKTGDCLPVVASDTVVDFDGQILGKPKNKEDVRKMLKMLSGNVHCVHTGIAIAYRGCLVSDVSTTSVFFRELDETEIRSYIECGEPMDKAGAYGIQGRAAAFVKKIDGDYHTVVGLPVCRMIEMLKELGIDAEELR